ncbi:YbjQ family protein [Acinetobacter gerneri]|uniref:YbjQ family protein n=1 Tax=Acinetobacter gerneri TaxID=202952 RepID=UPI0032125205
MQLSNLESMPGHRIIQQLGLVSGNTVQSKDFIQDAFAGLKNIIGGELTEYTELLEEARNEAMQRMIKKAEELGANAIVGIHFSTANIVAQASEILVYGTAVKVEEI